jgi:putative ATP-dependent endonuclease of OLD family
MMLEAYPEAYDVGEVEPPHEETIVAVLGKAHANEDLLGDDLLALFDDYHSLFNLKSKPASHLLALSNLTDEKLLEGLPEVLQRLVDNVRAQLEALPE